MPLVFVHGVSNRFGRRYESAVHARDALFRSFLLRSHQREHSSQISVTNPYWGDLGGNLRWHGASLPLAHVESLGSQAEALAELFVGALPYGDIESADRSVLQVARRSLPAAVDLLWAASAFTGTNDDLGALAVPVYTYAVNNPNPSWLSDVDDDQQFVTQLAREVRHSPPHRNGGKEQAPDWESLGIDSAWSAVRRGARGLRTSVAGLIGRHGSDRIRSAVIPGVASFLGDVFVYLHQQNQIGGPIRNRIASAIRDASVIAAPADPLVVVAHSMGGNITYDLLTGELSDVTIPLLITVGTQVGFFEELKLFRSSNDAIPGTDPTEKVVKPANIDRWINIFDYSDLLGFRVGTIIGGVDDFSYRTGSLLKAHSQYFLQPGFHYRLAARVGGSR